MTATHKDDGVHRLLDMVVEEVSLVDRAANQRRFLIVKRDLSMEHPTDTDKAVDPGAGDDTATVDTAETAASIAEGSPLGMAVAALESLTAIVELLGSLGADRADTRLAALAQQLRATAEQILERTGFAEPAEPATDVVEASAKAGPPAAVPEVSDGAAGDIAAAKAALSRLAEIVGKTAPPKTEKRDVALPDAGDASLRDSLAKLSESFRQLADTVKEQQQRLGRVEKQFGLPNSAAHAERVSKTQVEEVGWPLDLNHPMDRESVDKAVSFHDS